MQSTASINLLKSKSNLAEEVVKWAFNIGRLLIIIVEIVAFSAFIYRFSLDRRLVDLHDSIEQKQNTIASLEKQENEFRALQDRISLSTFASTDGVRSLNVINQIVSFTPSGIKFDSFIVGENKAELIVIANTMSDFSAFLKSLQDYDQIDSVNITQIDSKNNSVNINMTINLKPLKPFAI